ncbi:MAG: alpha/beta hydrolase, partial [Candidatus Omnitrophica bacterium]|nr:alpha/beta hydrolase [Candidatus Omnitrophota bacterium]
MRDRIQRLMLYILMAMVIAVSLMGCSAGEINVERAKIKKVSIGDIELAYKEFGSGYPLVLIMGYGSTMDMWDTDMLKELARKRRVIVFDNRGMGLSTADDKEFTIELFARDTNFFMKALGIERADVLGFSLGAKIALELALDYPERVRKLVLYATNFGGEDAIPAAPDVMEKLTDTSGTAKERADRMIKLILPDEWLKANPGYIKLLPRVDESSTAENMKRQARAMKEWKGAGKRLGLIIQDTLAITGNEDIVTPPGNSLILATRIPRSWLVRLKGGGH